MKLLREASEDEVIAEFLKAEVDSTRFGEAVFEARAAEGLDRTIVDNVDLTDTGGNDARRRVLTRARFWRSHIDLFAGFPDDVSWHLAELDRSDLQRVLYIDWEDWLEVSGGTRRPADAVPRIRSGETRFASEYDAIEARVRGGPSSSPVSSSSASETDRSWFCWRVINGSRRCSWPSNSPIASKSSSARVRTSRTGPCTEATRAQLSIRYRAACRSL